MANTTTRLTEDALTFLTERHLAMLTTLRADNSPHVVAVGFTFDPKTHIVRVITTGGSQKAVNADRGGVAVLSQDRQRVPTGEITEWGTAFELQQSFPVYGPSGMHWSLYRRR